jgi:hypothetical protein
MNGQARLIGIHVSMCLFCYAVAVVVSVAMSGSCCKRQCIEMLYSCRLEFGFPTQDSIVQF